MRDNKGKYKRAPSLVMISSSLHLSFHIHSPPSAFPGRLTSAWPLASSWDWPVESPPRDWSVGEMEVETFVHPLSPCFGSCSFSTLKPRLGCPLLCLSLVHSKYSPPRALRPGGELLPLLMVLECLTVRLCFPSPCTPPCKQSLDCLCEVLPVF